MAHSLDLEEQEQLDQIKHFWKRYGNLITWTLIAVFGSIATWNAWQYWQHKQAVGASALYDEVDRAVGMGDATKISQAWSDLKKEYGGTALAQQGALLAARGLFDAGDTSQAQAALEWTASQAKDDGLKAIARLRLAALALDAGKPEAARQWLNDPMPVEFTGLQADRLGDVQVKLGQSAEAKSSYLKAYKALGATDEYRRLVAVKLNAMGVDPSTESQP